MARRRAKARELTTIYWRDIPAQVTASANGETAKVMLEPRFQHAIDRAAAVADLTETEAYIAQWRKVSCPIEGDAKDVAEKTAAGLDGEYPRDRLEQLVAQGGTEAGSDQAAPATTDR